MFSEWPSYRSRLPLAAEGRLKLPKRSLISGNDAHHRPSDATQLKTPADKGANSTFPHMIYQMGAYQNHQNGAVRDSS